MTEDCGNCQQPRPPALRMEVMLDMLPVVVWQLMLPHQPRWQRPATPLATMRLSVHPTKGALEILR